MGVQKNLKTHEIVLNLKAKIFESMQEFVQQLKEMCIPFLVKAVRQEAAWL